MEQLRIAHVLQLLRRLIRRLEETLREKGTSGGCDPDFLFVVPRDDDLLFSLNAAKRRDSLSISCPSQFSFQPRNFRFQLCLKTYAEGMAAVPTSPGITYMD